MFKSLLMWPSKSGILLLVYFCLLGSLNAIPYYGNNFASDVEFVPLERRQPQLRNNDAAEKPFDIDVVTSDVGGHGENAQGGILFHQSFPFFGPDFFNSFGDFGIGPQQPWWKGPNVCTDRKEEEQDMDEIKKNSNDSATSAATQIDDDIRAPFFGQFDFSVSSCIEKSNKYVCTRILNQNGKKKTISITRQCCRGYGRQRNDAFVTCEKIDIKSIEDTAAEIGAKEFITLAKSNAALSDMLKKNNVTIFLPLDNVFHNYSEHLQNNVIETKADEAMINLYSRHIVNGEVNLEDASNDEICETQQKNQSVRINIYQLPFPLAGSETFRYTANCVPIEKYNKLTEHGLVHTLSGVMKPVKNTVMDIIRQRPDMSIMRTVLETTKLHEILEGNKPVTIFAPTDDSFEKLEPHLRRALKEGKGCATNILKNHILDLTFCSAASVPGARTTAYNLLGETMRFNRSKQVDEQVIINDKARILEADIMGTNGVLHIISTVVPTESALPLTTLMQEKNITLFKSLLEASGLDEKFDDMDNVTIFAPTNKALQHTKWATLLAESPDKLQNNAELVEMINYHVVKPMIKTSDLSEKLLISNDAAKSNLRVNLYSTHSLFSNIMNLATVNCARLIHFDDESCGSVLHQVDKLLTPPKMNLLQMLENNPNYSKFLELVRATNLSDILTNTEEASSYTLFVPKNDIFEEVEEWENIFTKSPNELEDLVKTHIVKNVVCCAGIIPTNWPFVRTIESVNGVHLRVRKDRRPMVANSGITKCDLIASNGIIHEINDVIVPQKHQQQQQQQLQPNFAQHIGFGDLF